MFVTFNLLQLLRSDLELSRIEVEHLRNALETMRTEYEGRETAVRVCSCRFILLMVGCCKVPKSSKSCYSDLGFSYLLDANHVTLLPLLEDLYFLVGCRRVVLLLELHSSLAADGNHECFLLKFKRCAAVGLLELFCSIFHSPITIMLCFVIFFWICVTINPQLPYLPSVLHGLWGNKFCVVILTTFEPVHGASNISWLITLT